MQWEPLSKKLNPVLLRAELSGLKYERTAVETAISTRESLGEPATAEVAKLAALNERIAQIEERLADLG